MKKPSNNGELDSVVDSVTNKVLISDTTFKVVYTTTSFVKWTPNYVRFLDVKFS